MTTDETLEAEKLIASMRRDLFPIAGSRNDADELIELIGGGEIERVTAVFTRLIQNTIKLLQLVENRMGPETFRILDQMYAQAGPVAVLAEMSKRQLEYKPKLLDATGEMLGLFTSGLDKIEQALKEKAR